MNERTSPSGPPQRRCVYAWCVTTHGATVHPDDEDHRSAGAAATVRVRRGGARGVGEETELEVGVLRRVDDSETWVVVETGIGVALALTVEGARVLEGRLRDAVALGAPRDRDGSGC